MKIKQLQSLAVALSCVGTILAPAVSAAPGTGRIAPAMQAPRDVALHEGGVLVGQMVDAQGVAIADAAVSVQAAGKEITRVRTDKAGKFQVAGLKGGVHQIATADQQEVYRLWAPRTAPPAAQRGLMLVPNTDMVRGQGCGCGSAVNCGSACGGCGGGGIGGWIADHPVLTTAAIATAIAVPLALDDDDDAPATP